MGSRARAKASLRPPLCSNPRFKNALQSRLNASDFGGRRTGAAAPRSKRFPLSACTMVPVGWMYAPGSRLAGRDVML